MNFNYQKTIETLNNYRFVTANRSTNESLLCVKTDNEGIYLSTVKRQDVTCMNLFFRWVGQWLGCNIGPLANVDLTVKDSINHVFTMIDKDDLSDCKSLSEKGLESIQELFSKSKVDSNSKLKRDAKLEKLIQMSVSNPTEASTNSAKTETSSANMAPKSNITTTTTTTTLSSEEQTPPMSDPTFITAGLVKAYDACWNQEENDFVDLPYDPVDLVAKFQEQVKLFPFPHNVDTDYGYIEKRDLAPGSQVFVRADLHSDLKSLLENVKTLQAQGLLDENYKCKENVQLVFLGDYMDRGRHGLQVLELLMAMRKENPTQITLIRGNHEDANQHELYYAADKNLIEFHSSSAPEESLSALGQFYDTMPLTVYLGEKNQEGVTQYVHFTHGMFELYVDPSDIIDSKESFVKMSILSITGTQTSKENKPISLSPRLNNLAECEVIVGGSEKESKKKSKSISAAKRIKELHLADKSANRLNKRAGTAYNWGDVKAEGKPSNIYIFRNGWGLTPDDIHNYMLISGSTNKVKYLFRGHSHLMEERSRKSKKEQEKNKSVLTTLTVGSDTHPSFQSRYNGQHDTSFILTTAQKVKDWNKIVLTREENASTVAISGPYGIREALDYVAFANNPVVIS